MNARNVLWGGAAVTVLAGLDLAGVLLLDRIRFSTDIPWHKLVLAAVIVGLQICLMLPTNSKGAHEHPESPQQRDAARHPSEPRRALPFAWSERPAGAAHPIVVLGSDHTVKP